MDLLTLLVQKDLIRESDIDTIQQEVQSNEHSLEEALRSRGVNNEDILNAKSELYNVPTRDLTDTSIPFETLKLIPEESAKHYQIIPLAVQEGVMEVGFVNPDNIEARDAVQFIASKNNMPFKAFVISEGDFNDALEAYGGLSGEVNQALDELETELSADEEKISEDIQDLAASSDELGEAIKSGEDAQKIVEDAPVTKIVATVLRYATEGGASDVHIEPMENKIRVRFRVDGVLHTSLVLPRSVLSAVVARVKILSSIKLDERRKPQDGRFSAHIEGRKIDFRVSTFPTYYGEKVVMRILDPEKGHIPLEDLGMTKRNYRFIQEAIKQPYGLVLISGPTGSGKTTTLYSMLREVDRESKNVLSLEDPIEYNISGMNQSQVRPEIGYTFANGLRTTLRQDPDIIMVGEIRDKETAGLAIQAALTGHLVLSTIHTNSAVGVIPRLVDMGVDPYLIAPTLVLAVAQRLVKKLCPNAGKKVAVEGSIKKMIENEFEGLPEKYIKSINTPDHVYQVDPTPECPGGTRGRVAVFEMLRMTDDIEQVILNDPNDVEVFKAARADGMLTMREDALLKAFAGEIPFEEVNRLRK